MTYCEFSDFGLEYGCRFIFTFNDDAFFLNKKMKFIKSRLYSGDLSLNRDLSHDLGQCACCAVTSQMLNRDLT
ncbi:hypothetical protein PGB90_007310 [Kerria lacca]